MRTSSGVPLQNGWALTSSRPCAKSKPTASISRAAARRCAAIGNGPGGSASGGCRCLAGQHRLDQIGQETRRSRRTGGRSSRPSRPARNGRAAPRKGLTPRRSALAAATSRCRRSISSSNGRTAAKSSAGRALRHTVSHSDEMRATASTRSPGTAAACPRRRRISRRLALLPRVERAAFALGLGQQIADLGGGQLLVGEAGSRSRAARRGWRHRPAASSSRCPNGARRSLPRARPAGEIALPTADRRSSGLRVAAMKKDIDDDHRNRQGKPRDRVLQVVVGQMPAG